MNKKLPQIIACALASFATICGVPASAQSSAGEFACRIFQKQSRGGENCLVSPLSLYLALAMTANGAGGETRQSMGRLLGAPADGNFDDFNRLNGTLLRNLNANKAVRISINNAIFADNGSHVEKSFVTLCQDTYQAVVQNADFASPATVTLINNWCAAKTEGKISSILDRLKSDEKMVLLNTVYFKGNWQTPFNAAKTSAAPFHLLDGTVQNVETMHGLLPAKHLKTAQFEALALPYAGESQHLYIFLPGSKAATLQSLVESMSGDKWQQWSQKFENCRAQVALPKCTFSSQADLGSSLKEMGIASAFGARADFTKMFGSRSGCIGRVLQKTFIDIDEAGTEAAAATAVIMRPMGMRMPEPEIPFVVDRPFVLALVDDESKQFLFLGAVYNPKTK